VTTRTAAIVERDGPHCVWCGRRPWPRDLTLEHLLPRSRGGHGTPENLTPACRRCNRERRSRPVAAYVATSPRPAESDYGARQLDLLRR
jgi:5-methylcytosine-specific restriction endonuclease McrA